MPEQAVPSQNEMPTEHKALPMGPLEQGDQALVDAMATVPDGRFETTQDGTSTQVMKLEVPGTNALAARTSSAGSSEAIWANHGTEPGGASIGAGINSRSGSPDANPMIHVVGNEIGENADASVVDRQAAQAAKLEIARKIETAGKQLGDMSVEAATDRE